MAGELNEGWDEQDGAETFDEDNQNLDGAGQLPGEMRTFEELPDVFDVTSASGDADDDEALIAEELDDDEIIALEADYDAADIENDPLQNRMAEAFDDDSLSMLDAEEVEFAEEAGLDLRSADDTDSKAAEAAQGALGLDEPELDYDDSIEEDADEGSVVMEATGLSDEELERLGYRIDPS